MRMKPQSAERSPRKFRDGTPGPAIEIKYDIAAILRWAGLFILSLALMALALVRPDAVLTLGCAAGAATGRPCPAPTSAAQPTTHPRRRSAFGVAVPTSPPSLRTLS
jgi:hypothetical protein